MPLFKKKNSQNEGLPKPSDSINNFKKTVHTNRDSVSKWWNSKGMRNTRRNMSRDIKKGMRDQGVGSFEIGVLVIFIVAGIILIIVK